VRGSRVVCLDGARQAGRRGGWGARSRPVYGAAGVRAEESGSVYLTRGVSTWIDSAARTGSRMSLTRP
jgi:hypothetical protein